MTEPPAEKPAPKARVKRRKAVAKPRRAVAVRDPTPPNEFAGMSIRSCPDGCTSSRCIISTVEVCKHPKLTPSNGCGPVTLRNRERAARYLRLQEVERT